jgi:hypothetical protein
MTISENVLGNISDLIIAEAKNGPSKDQVSNLQSSMMYISRLIINEMARIREEERKNAKSRP